MFLIIIINNDPLDTYIYIYIFWLLVYGVLIYTTKDIIFEYIDTIDEFPVPDLILKIIRFFDASVVVALLEDEHKSPFHAMFNQNNRYFPHALYKIWVLYLNFYLLSK